MGKRKESSTKSRPEITQEEEKICIKCNETKSISCFQKRKECKDGHINQCKICLSKYAKEYRKNNKEKIKQYTLINKDKLKIYHKKYSKNWEANNKEKRRNQKKINFKIWRGKNKDYNKIYKKNNPPSLNQKISTLLSTRINELLKTVNSRKSSSSRKLLGCSVEFFKEYIESKFTKGMTWENRGIYGWHLDHINPCSSFDLTDPEQQKICFHYTNYQPLWSTTEIAMKYGEDENYIGNVEKGGVRLKKQ